MQKSFGNMNINVLSYQSNGKYAEKLVETRIEFYKKCIEVLTKLEMKFIKCREVPKI